MIDEDVMDEIVERSRALGTDYEVLADILRLIAEVRRLRATDEATERMMAECLRLREAEAARVFNHYVRWRNGRPLDKTTPAMRMYE